MLFHIEFLRPAILAATHTSISCAMAAQCRSLAHKSRKNFLYATYKCSACGTTITNANRCQVTDVKGKLLL